MKDGQACSDGCPSECQQKQKWAGGEGGCNGNPTHCTLFNNDHFLLWCPRFLLQILLVIELLTPIPSSCLFGTNSCFHPGSVLQIPLSSTHPALYLETQDSGWGVQGCSKDHACRSYSVLPFTDQLLHSHLIPKSFLSVPADPPQ